MSVENLKEYASRCAAEPELRAKAKEIGLSDMDEHMRHAKSLGLDWNSDDMVAFRKEVIDDQGGLEDLSEEELEKVAGGVVSITIATAVGIGVGAAAAVGVVGGAGAAAAAGGAAAAGDGAW